MSDVFRFVAIRPPQSTDTINADRNRIILGPYGVGSPLYQSLIKHRAAGERGAMLRQAQTYIESDAFVGAPGLMWPPLAALDAWLKANGNRVSPGDLRAQIAHSFAVDPGDVISGDGFQNERRRLADSLLSLGVVPNPGGTAREQAVRGLIVLALLERFLDTKLPAMTADDIKRFLTESIVLLPQDVFPLPTTARPDRGGTRKKPPAGDSAERELQDIRNAMRELQGLLSEHAAIQSVAVNARDGMLAPGLANSTDGEAIPRPAPWMLPRSSAARLSAASRAALAGFQGDLDTLDVPAALTFLERSTAAVGLTRSSQPRTMMVAVGGSIMSAADALRQVADADEAVVVPEAPDLKLDGSNAPSSRLIRRPGVADLMVVRQELLRYEPGEVAHIESVLLGESKERVHKRAVETEETTVVESETLNETERDTESTERFELQRESAKAAQQASSAEAGVQVSASYGPTVSVDLNAGFSVSSAKQESERTASQYARETTERAVERVQERVRQERTVRTLTSIEETNTHGIDNREGKGNTTGVYRWVDKLYRAQVFNYGRRLMIELHIPEPAAFYLFANTSQPREGSTLMKPEEPMYGWPPQRPLAPTDITVDSYLYWAGKYHAADVAPPPPLYTTVGIAWEDPPQQGAAPRQMIGAKKLLTIPEGYVAERFVATVALSYSGTISGFLGVGGNHWFWNTSSHPWWFSEQLAGQRGELPILIGAYSGFGFALAMEVLCRRSDEAETRWQLETYETVMRAYFELKERYDEQVNARAAGEGIAIRGRNPAQNRRIEQAELKRNAITMLRADSFGAFDAIVEGADGAYPDIDLSEARREGLIVQFFEQSFDWPQMTYTYYPYFWGRKSRWIAASQLDDPDPQFAAFLQAGAARALVPVRPGFEKAALYFLATGNIWDGATIPQVGDEFYLSLAAEIESAQSLAGGVAVGESWEVRVPTSLVWLQPGPDLPTFLPA